jgi:hypothetical protein
MEFPWWICFGTIVTFSVAILFQNGREHQPSDSRRCSHRDVAPYQRSENGPEDRG